MEITRTMRIVSVTRTGNQRLVVFGIAHNHNQEPDLTIADDTVILLKKADGTFGSIAWATLLSIIT